jgi:hypothetical protein
MRGQCGQASRFTAEQIAAIRQLDDEYRRVSKQRDALRSRLGMTRDDWSRYSRGILGKKPARVAA